MAGKTKERSDLSYYVAHVIEESMAKTGESLRDLAKRWGTTHAKLSGVQTHLHGIGTDVEFLLANVLTNGKRDQLHNDAAEWRRRNPNWEPAAYKKKHAAKLPKRSDWTWWPKLAAKATEKNPHLGWAIWAAGNEPSVYEPKKERRTLEYVVSCAERLLDILSEEEQERLENEHRREFPPKQPPSPRNSPSGIHGVAR